VSRLSSTEGGAGPDNPAATPPAGAEEADAAAPDDDATAGRATPAESGASAEPGPGAHEGAAPTAEATGESPPPDAPPADTPAAESDTPDTPEPQGTAPEAAPPEPEVTPADDERRALLDAFATELGDDLLATEVKHDDVWLRVRSTAWRRTADVCRSLGFDYFCFLSGMDWMPSSAPSHKAASATVDSDAGDEDEDAAAAEAAITADEATTAADQAAADEDATAAGGPRAWATGYAGGDTRFQVLARLYSTARHEGVTLKADLDDDAPAVETWSTVYRGADWHERETWEMFGFDFVGHPNLSHLYLPGEFEGFPLRKDFPLLAREVKPWPGLVDVEPMPEEEDEEPAAATSGGSEEGGES
jgi:NADH-quinone oxidoreductase subunit C